MQLAYVSLNYITLLGLGPAMHHKMLQKWRFSDGTRYELKEISPGLASPVKRLLDDTILLEMKRMPWYSVAVSSFPYHRCVLRMISTCKQHEFMRSHKPGYDMGRKGSSPWFGMKDRCLQSPGERPGWWRLPWLTVWYKILLSNHLHPKN